MKKIIIVLFVLLFFIIIYIVSNQDNNQQERIKPIVKETEQTLPNITPPSKKTDNTSKEYIEEYIEDKPLTDQQIEELDKYFEQTEKDWLKKIENLFLTKWNLDKEYLKKYKLIRKNNEQEKVDMYQKFHQEMVEKHGDNYSYNSTEEDLLMNTKIDEIYLQKIKDLLGKKHYSEYLKLKSKFNENLEKNHNPELGLIEIQI